MKRKRKHHGEQPSSKRAKPDARSHESPAWPLLCHYYPNVSTLRQYLAAKLSKTSRKRCRTILRYGKNIDSSDSHDEAAPLVQLLDGTIVGSFTGTESIDLDTIDRDMTVFTQQLSDSTISISSTQGPLKQSEVGLI